jgi:hypothetical protein
MRDKGSPEEHEHRRLLDGQQALEGSSTEEVAEFLGVVPRSVRRWTVVNASLNVSPRHQLLVWSDAGVPPCDDAPNAPRLAIGSDRGAATPAQYASAETTSPPAMLVMAHQVAGLTVDFTVRTEPSIIRVLATPGWRLPAVVASASLSELVTPRSQL